MGCFVYIVVHMVFLLLGCTWISQVAGMTPIVQLKGDSNHKSTYPTEVIDDARRHQSTQVSEFDDIGRTNTLGIPGVCNV